MNPLIVYIALTTEVVPDYDDEMDEEGVKLSTKVKTYGDDGYW